MAEPTNTTHGRTMRGVLIVGFLALLALAAVVWWRFARPTGQRPVIRIAAATWAGFGSAFVGVQQNFFTDMDVSYTVVDDLNARHAAFSSAKANVLTTSLDLWVQELAQGLKGSPFLVTDESAGGDGIVAKREIRSSSGLKGK